MKTEPCFKSFPQTENTAAQTPVIVHDCGALWGALAFALNNKVTFVKGEHSERTQIYFLE